VSAGLVLYLRGQGRTRGLLNELLVTALHVGGGHK
jgi:GTP cyclohydrolase II